MTSSINLAQAGIINAAVRFEASSKRAVETTIDARAIEPVEQMLSKQAFVANTATLKTADQMLGSLLDIKA